MIRKVRNRYPVLIIFNLLVLVSASTNTLFASDLSTLGLHVIPYPQEVKISGPDFVFTHELTIVLDKSASVSDRFTAEELITDLKSEWDIVAKVGPRGTNPSIVLTRHRVPESLKDQGYQLISRAGEVTISAKQEDGLFYGTQKFLQLILRSNDGFKVPGLTITDWPDILKSASYSTISIFFVFRISSSVIAFCKTIFKCPSVNGFKI